MWPGTPAIDEYTGVTRAQFEAEIVPAGMPAVLRGLVGDWPAVKAGRQSPETLADYLRQVPEQATLEAWFAPPADNGRFGYTDDLSGFNFERRVLTLADLLDYLLASRDDPAAFSAYAGGIPIPKVIPDLLRELPMPLLDADREMLVSLWLGNRAFTAAHWDVPQNLACVLMGRRRFTLFPTAQVANLYVGPIDPTPAGQAISLVDFSNPDFERFPRFREAMANAVTAELEPGDAIYIPSLWWHHVESPDPIGAMINFWWRDGPDHLMTPLFTLFHSLLTIRDMPANERAAWRELFDHYIFRPSDGDPLAHIPEERRGLLGLSTAELRQRLAKIIAGPLG